MSAVRGTACARAGLLGNPSDQYEGRAIALTLPDFEAAVTIERAERFEIVPGEADETAAPDARVMIQRLGRDGCHGGVRLLQAALLRFSGLCKGLAEVPDEKLRFRMGYRSTIPRQVGMSGSSAIVIAGLRALSEWFEQPIESDLLATIALAAETDDLGIQAGPMDRVIQAHGGVLFMDFAASRWRRLDPTCLPPLYVAWDPDPGRESGVTHQSVRTRWLAGDAQVRAAMREFPVLADEGLACLECGDVERLCELVDRNFELRRSIFELPRADHELVRIGRDAGAAVKLCGSGGSVIGVLRDAAQRPAVERAYVEAGYRVLEPRTR